ncbi:Uncharacterised protein [Vibrio cholerae]|nr:Uncharacterised protein [Vibrio cholerae]
MLNNRALMKHYDAIAITHRRQAMSNRDHRTASGNAGHIGLNDGLRFVIQFSCNTTPTRCLSC